jgi:CubicO group peptidase (beta-lactamase class C family)
MRPGTDRGPDEDDHSRADRCLAPLVSGGDVPALAYAVVRDGDRELIWHNGMTGGYSAMIAFDPVRSLGAAALANSAGVQPSPLDGAVFDVLG